MEMIKEAVGDYFVLRFGGDVEHFVVEDAMESCGLRLGTGDELREFLILWPDTRLGCGILAYEDGQFLYYERNEGFAYFFAGDVWEWGYCFLAIRK